MKDLKPNKRLLLGYGDIAQRLAKISLADEIPVTAVRRTPMQSAPIEPISGSVTNPETLGRVIEENIFDIVVTLTPDNYSAQGYRDTYLACAQALAKILPTDSPQSRVVFISSTSVYGQDNGELVDEESDCHPRSETAKVLLESEAAISGIGVTHCNLRFSGIYGPGRTRIIERTKSGNIPPRTPTHWTNRIHSDDCARAIDHLLRINSADLPSYVLATDSLPAPRYDVQTYIADQLGISASSDTPNNSGNEETGKRCSNKLLLGLGFELLYPDYREGFSKLIQSEH